jgi:zinc protease
MYLGSLKNRDHMKASTLDELRTLTRPVGPREVTKEFETQTPMAMVFSGFYTADQENVAHNRAMQMAAQTLSSRMIKVIREQEQLVYSISAGNNAGTTWPGFGMFASMVPTERAKAPALAAKIKGMFDEFAQTGPTEEEMTTVKKQLANTFEEQMKEPSTWVSRMSTMGYRNLSLDDFLAANDAYQSMTAQQVKDVFNTYYKPESFMSATLLPKE